VLAAMRRHANGHWRTNVAQGGKAEKTAISSEMEELALRASAAVQATMSGVDILPGVDGKMYVLEVNAVPGWRALASVTGIDIATEILRFFTLEFPDRVGGS
jgi:ribosomal protein S6--L-glutamate ligase